MLLTIAITTYHRKDLLSSCLDSIFKQINEKDDWLEVLVVDNCSTDGTPEYLKTLSYPQLRIILNSKNIGIPNNLGKATQLSSGKYVMWLTDDDLIIDGGINKLYNLLSTISYDVSWIFSPIYTVDYKTDKFMTSLGPNSPQIINIDPGLGAILKYAKYGFVISRQIFLKSAIDPKTYGAHKNNMYFLLAYVIQMLAKHKTLFSPEIVVKHIYGNEVFWGEWNKEGAAREAKAHLDFLAIGLISIKQFSNSNKIITHVAWNACLAWDWVYNEFFSKKILLKMYFVFKEAAASKRMFLAIYFMFNIFFLSAFVFLKKLKNKSYKTAKLFFSTFRRNLIS